MGRLFERTLHKNQINSEFTFFPNRIISVVATMHTNRETCLFSMPSRPFQSKTVITAVSWVISALLAFSRTMLSMKFQLMNFRSGWLVLFYWPPWGSSVKEPKTADRGWRETVSIRNQHQQYNKQLISPQVNLNLFLFLNIKLIFCHIFFEPWTQIDNWWVFRRWIMPTYWKLTPHRYVSWNQIINCFVVINDSDLSS